MNVRDLTGQKFGLLTVIQQTKKPENYKTKGVYWICKCDCGNIKTIFTRRLIDGKAKSCGCNNLACGKKTTKNDFCIKDNFAYIYIPNSKNRCIIDADDLEKVLKHHWNMSKKGYIYSKFMENKISKIVYIHRLVLGVKDKRIVDHINGNPLDNRKCNLRIVSRLENVWNHKEFITNTSGFTGIKKNKKGKEWSAFIGYKNKYIHLGSFDNKQDAINARKTAEIKYYGEYRRKENEERK